MKAPEEIIGTESERWTFLLDAFHEFDKQTSPMGFYGIQDYESKGTPHPPLLMEWERVIKPTMGKFGCQPAKVRPVELKLGAFQFQDGALIDYLKVVRVSKIKVRRYGNTYRIDPHKNFGTRWKAAGLGAVFDDLWKYRKRQANLVLFIGFANEDMPFKAELEEMESSLTFKKRYQPAIVKKWEDPHGRGFKVVAALWHVPKVG